MIVRHMSTPVMRVSEREPPTGEDEPDDVADQRSGAGVRPTDEGAPEWPQAKESHARRGDAERDGDDEDEHHERHDRVAKGEPEAAEDEPDQVQQQPHSSTLLCPSP